MSLMEQDFSQICARTRYCFTCSQGFCLDCCTGHEAFHHPGNEQARIVQVRVVRHVHCIQEEDLKGIRYDLRGIQKFNVEGVKYIPIKRNILPGTMPLTCKRCGDRMYVGKDYCGLLCRLQHVPGGNVQSRAIVSALAHTPFHRQAVDRFCTVCQRLFYSSCCADHIASHHPGQTEVGSVLRILRRDGMILIPLSDLVEFDEADLTQIETIAFNGYNTVAVKRTANHLNDEAGNLCIGCFNIIGESFSYCSLPCMVHFVYD
ncbi:hypothetical protein BS78_06G133900 [Paspalum vaginatum]|nr:hypothetical protein BS78_06G133900 [Paspalum vaginatum]